jgi:hypothetical protein
VPSLLRSLPASSFAVAPAVVERLLVANSNMRLPVAASVFAIGVGCPSFGGQRAVVLLQAKSRGDLSARRARHRCCAFPRRRDMRGCEVGAKSGSEAAISNPLPNPSLERTSLRLLRSPKAAAQLKR